VAEFPNAVGDRDAAELWGVLGPLWQSPLVGQQKLVPTAADKNLCAVVERYLKMNAGACNEALARDLLAFSARNGGATTFAVGAELRLPLIEVETFKALRHFDLKSARQRAEIEELYKDSAYSVAKQREYLIKGGTVAPTAVPQAEPTKDLPKDGVLAVETEGVRWKVPLSGNVKIDDLNILEGITAKLSTPSRVVGVERAAPLERVPPQKFARSPPVVLDTQCTGAPATRPTPPVSYARLLATDPIHSAVELAAARACAPAGEAPRIAIIDKPIARHPDLRVALGLGPSPAPAGGPVCGLVDGALSTDEAWHGTYLAGIIAARGEHAPYRGINPDVRLVRIPDTGGPVGVRRALFEAYRAGFPSNPPQIAVFASIFGADDPPAAGGLASKDLAERFKRHNGKWIDELRDRQTRLGFPPFARDVIDSSNYRYLFIVSAGQDNSKDSWASPLSLRDVTNMSPQNLGTRHNVLVVTACAACDAANGEAAIWPRAYFSSPGDQIVQLAAPGGDHLPGIVSEQHTGGPDAGGTSAAAAIVAGIASRMLACYPAVYRSDPRLIKDRLLVTARRNLNPEDAPKAQAGIVDPDLAMIDPEKTWLKPTGLPLESIIIKGLCNKTLDMLRDEAGDPVPENPAQERIQRITRAGDAYTIREMARVSLGQDTPALKISSLRPESWQATQPIAVLTRPDKPLCHLYLRHVQDLIVGFRDLGKERNKLWAEATECRKAGTGALKPCFE
jgi:subtilisin family serine protease